MKIAVFSAKPYDQRSLAAANADAHELAFFEERLGAATAAQANGYGGVCAFVNDVLDRGVLEILAAGGTRLIAMRCAGYNNVDLDAAQQLGIAVVRVPAYSPRAVAEHATALLLALNRKIHLAYNRVRASNFALEGLQGFDLYGKAVGVVGTGKIGLCFVRIMLGFGCRVLCYDPFPSPELDDLNVDLVELPDLLAQSDVVSLHCPLTPETHYLIAPESLASMKPGAILINTSRGGLVDTKAAVESLEAGRLGGLGIDVYENEAALFFEDRSAQPHRDELFERLIAFPNVIVTGHQAFLTHEALENIANTTINNITQWEATGEGRNLVVG